MSNLERALEDGCLWCSDEDVFDDRPSFRLVVGIEPNTGEARYAVRVLIGYNAQRRPREEEAEVLVDKEVFRTLLSMRAVGELRGLRDLLREALLDDGAGERGAMFSELERILDR